MRTMLADACVQRRAGPVNATKLKEAGVHNCFQLFGKFLSLYEEGRGIPVRGCCGRGVLLPTRVRGPRLPHGTHRSALPLVLFLPSLTCRRT